VKARAALPLIALLAAGSARAETGERWYASGSPTDAYLYDIGFSDDGEGWIVGARSTVLRYDGASWGLVPGPGEDETLVHLGVAGRGDVWVSGPSSELFHFLHGHWTSVPLDPGAEVAGLDFASPTLGYAVGLFGIVYRYDGARWSRVEAPAITHDRESHLMGVVVLAADDVWIAGQSGFVLHFDGRTWTRSTTASAPAAGSKGIARLDGTVALLGTPMLVRRGERWEARSTPAMRSIAGHGGSLWGVTPESALVELGAEGARPVPRGRDLSHVAASKEAAWAVGGRGVILRTRPERLPSFVDRTFEAGVGILAPSPRVAIADLGGSGWPDLLLYGPSGPHAVLGATGPGTFRAQAADLRLEGALAAADLDGDGSTDLLVRPPGRAGARPWRLLRNLGGWRFRESDQPLEALPGADASQIGTLELADLDGDGDLDVYETRFIQEPIGLQVPNVLWINDGLGRLSPVPLAHHDGGGSLGWSRAALLADLDGDGRTDILSVNAWADGNAFFRQTGSGRFEDATRGSRLAGAVQDATGVVAGDVDGDGALDVLVLALPAYGPSRLFHNDGRGHFRDVTSEAGLELYVASDDARAELADLDNDGDLDLVVCSGLPLGATARDRPRTRVFLNDGRGHFTDITDATELGLAATDLVVEDFDGDGDLDIYLVRDGDSNRLFANDSEARGWLEVRPEGRPPNRAAIGARISVFAPDGRLLGVRETSWRHPVAHFGLGEATTAYVEVRFPAGATARVDGVRAGQALAVAEGHWPERAAWTIAFDARHWMAWANLPRELLQLSVAVLALVLMRRLAAPLNARRMVRRAPTLPLLLLLYLGLELPAARLAPVSRIAAAGPLTAALAACAALLWVDRALTLRAEARFVGPYELQGALGQGGMGTVYRARDTTAPSRAPVALKVLHSQHVGTPASLGRFVREAEVGARLSHPGIVSVLASGECRVLEGRVWRKTAYLAMELVEGASLAALLREGETLSIPRAVEIVRDAAAALAAAHALGVLHRDVKPDNILLSRAGVVKLADFGIAAMSSSATLTQPGTMVGTLAYLSPERAAGRPEDGRSDLYSLGCVLYEAICRRHPIPAGDPRAVLSAVLGQVPPRPRDLRPEIPPALDELIMSLLAKDPAQRPASASALVLALEGLLQMPSAETPAAVPPASAPPKAAEPPEHHERVTLDLPPR